MRRVLHLRSSGAFLGAENVILQLASSSQSLGFQSVVGVIHDRRDNMPALALKAKSQGHEVIVFSASKRFDIECIKEIKSYVLNNDIDLIHTHGYKEDIYLFLSRITLPVIATNHLWKKTNFLLKLYALLDSLILSRFNKIVAVSQPVRKDMLSYPWLKSKNIDLISNGIDSSQFCHSNIQPVSELKCLAEKGVLLGTVSSLTIEKGHRFLIEALASQPLSGMSWYLVIVGDGPMLETLRALVIELALTEKVTFLGQRDDIANILAELEVFILPSLNEGLPMALLEAMASEKAIISTRVGDIPSLVSDEHLGLLVEPAESLSLARAIEFAVNDSAWRSAAGRAAKKLVLSEYSATSMAGKYAEAYRMLI